MDITILLQQHALLDSYLYEASAEYTARNDQ